MDAATLRPQLPALGFADMDKVNRDEDAYQSRNTGVQPALPPTNTTTAAAATSPTYPYPQGPPPPYSHPVLPPQPHQITSPAAHAVPDTPPASRQGVAEEKDTAAKQPPRQSLPSISEALGVDSQAAYQTAPLSQSTQPRPAIAASPTPAKRPYPMDPPQLSRDHYSTAHPSYTHSTPAQSYPPQDPSRPNLTDSRPSLQLQTAHSPTARPAPQPASYPYSPAHPSPMYDRQPQSQQAPSQAPSAFPYGYTPYPPRYAQPPAPPLTTSGPIYQPSSLHGAPTTSQPPSSSTWKTDGPASRFASDERTYGESVKRHLDLYDIESALNDIASTSSILGDFARRYGDRLYRDQRVGPSLASLPGIIEVEDMIHKSRMETEALIAIRDVVIAQQAAYDQQTVEQQHNKAFAEPAGPAHAREGDDNKSDHFAVPETKKRRGRAAPAGRCHSCNRAETPEWRRGPDGARTLCNACGLHYAKLTRKQNNANKAAAVSSTNLRPKESM